MTNGTKKTMLIIEESALTQIVMSSLESYVIGDVKNRSGKIETYGLLWGTNTIQSEFGETVHFYHVTDVSTDTSAKRKKDCVESDLSSIELKRDIQRAINPTKALIGDFHSHPYSMEDGVEISDIRSQKLYEFSEQDHNSYTGNANFYKTAGLTISLVATVLPAKNQMSYINAKFTNAKLNNSFEFCLSNYRIWITGYRAHYSDDGTLQMLDDLLIHCPYIFGLQFPLMNFGYYSKEGSHQNYEFQ